MTGLSSRGASIRALVVPSRRWRAHIDATEGAFLDAARPRAVDTRCVTSMRLADFFTSPP
jgi:hypothetical protein